MLSSNSYLPPDYLQPLATTLDAKKSPLALLAQTCNSIGKDLNSNNNKSGLSSLDKKSDKKGDASVSPRQTSPEKSDRSKDEIGKGSPQSSSFRTPPPKDAPSHLPLDGETGEGKERRVGSRSPSPTTRTHSSSKISLNCGNVVVEVNHQQSAGGSSNNGGRSSSSAGPIGRSTPKSSSPSTSASLASVASLVSPSKSSHPLSASSLHSLPHHAASLSMLGHGLPLDSLYAGLPAHLGLGGSSAAAAAAAAHRHGLPPSSTSPYIGYTSVKNAGGATTLVPVCKDPYCQNCQISLRSAQLSTSACPAGCTQCSHEKALGLPPGLHGLPGWPPGHSSSTTHPAASLYPHHPFSVLPGQHSLPYVCNWVSNAGQSAEYCGKRFATSEELLQHLRTHTGSLDPAALHPSLAYSGLGALSASSPYSASALRGTYPRSLSPNSLLAASRFHPYKAALSGLATPGASSSTLPPGLHPSLSAYYPYSLYGSRLGAATAP